MNALQSLSSPRFPRVPAEFTFRRDAINPRMAKLARILLDLGLISEADAPRAPIDERKLVELGLQRWSERAIGRPLGVFGDVYLCVGSDNAEDFHQAHYLDGLADAPEIDPEKCVLLSLSPWDHGDQWILEPRCVALERRVHGLAEFALDLVDYGAGRSVPVMTPRRAWEQFQMYHEMNDDADAVAAVTLFKNEIPDWVYQPKRRFTRVKLAALADVDPVAATCLALMAAMADRKRTVPDVGDYWHCAFAAVLRWSTADSIDRVTDDYVHDAQNGGEGIFDYSLHLVELETAAVSRFLDGFGRLLRVLELTDRLISQIAEKAPEE